MRLKRMRSFPRGAEQGQVSDTTQAYLCVREDSCWLGDLKGQIASKRCCVLAVRLVVGVAAGDQMGRY